MNKILINELDYFLRNSELGKLLDPKELDTIFTHNEIISFEPGKTILQQGKQSDGIYIILQGNVIVTAKILGESIANIETLESGNFIGDISYIERLPCTTSIIAKTHVQCLIINHVYFELISAYFPETKYKILKAITKQACLRIIKLHDKIKQVINESDMVTRTYFREIIQSLTMPEQITIDEAGIPLTKIAHWQLFNSFNKADIDELLKHVVTLKAPKNCTLIDKNEQSNRCYIVIHGAVQSSIIQQNKIAKLSVIGPLTLFTGPACVEAHSPFTITFSTCESAILLMLDKVTLDFFENEYPAIWYKLFTFICSSILALEKSIAKLDIRLQIEIYNR